MPNKKKQRNGFYYFMKEMLEDMQRKGKTEYNMQNIAVIAHPEWKNLSQEEKDRYNNVAKKIKQECKDSLEGKLDCTGQPVKTILEEERIKEQRSNAKLRSIKSKIKELMNAKAVANEKFHIISFNIFCLTEEEVYVPAEVGLVEYSIAKGILREYHEFIDPGELPLGYTFTSNQHSEDTHKIPSSNFQFSNKNYMFIYRSIKTFIESKNKKYVLYCFPDEMDQVEGVLRWLHAKSLESVADIQVLDLSALLLEFRQFATREYGTESLAFAKDILTKNVFDYVPNISCAWHEEKDVPNHCALGIAKRYCYLMSDYLCALYGIEMIPNKHVPLRDDTENISIVNPIASKWHQKAKPIPSRSNPVVKSTPSAYSEKTTTIVTNLPSKFDTEKEKFLIPGADSHVVTEMPKTQSKLPNYNQPRPHFLSAANIVKKNENFELADEDFPSLENLSLGRGRGRGLSSFVFATESPKPATLTSAGLGRGCIWKINK